MADTHVQKSLLPINNPFTLLHASLIRTPLFRKYLHAIHEDLSVELEVSKLRGSISNEQQKRFEDLCRARLYLLAGLPGTIVVFFYGFFNTIGIQVYWQQSILFILSFTWGLIFKDMILWSLRGRFMWIFNLLSICLFIVFLIPFTLNWIEYLLYYYYYNSLFLIQLREFLRVFSTTLHDFDIDRILMSIGSTRFLLPILYGIAVGLVADGKFIPGIATSVPILLTNETYMSVQWWFVFGFFSVIFAILFVILVTLFLENVKDEVQQALAKLLAVVVGVGIAGSLVTGFYDSVLYGIVWGTAIGLTAGRNWSIGEGLPFKYRRVIAWGVPLSFVAIIAGFVAMSLVVNSSDFLIFGLPISLRASVAFCGSWLLAYSISYTRLPLYLLWEVPVSWCVCLLAALFRARAHEFWRWQPITYNEYAMFPISATTSHLVILSEQEHQGFIQAINELGQCRGQQALLSDAMSKIIQRSVSRAREIKQIAEFNECTSWLPRQHMVVSDVLSLERLRSVSRIVKEALQCPNEQRRMNLLQLQEEYLRRIIDELRASPRGHTIGLVRDLSSWLDVLERERFRTGG
jgi:hypothetical protein